MVRGMRDAQWEWGGEEAEETPQTLAKTWRTTPCLHAACTLLTRSQHAERWLVMRGLDGAEGVVHGVGEVRKEEADARVPAWLINKAHHRIAGAGFPDQPVFAGNRGFSGHFAQRGWRVRQKSFPTMTSCAWKSCQ